MLTAPSSTPFKANEIPSREFVRQQLLAGKFAEVDALLSSVQDAFERGNLPDSQSARAWNAFTGYRPDLTGPLERWVKQFPQSYAAQLALGMHLKAKGSKLRTYRRAKDVPPERWQEISDLFSAAQGHLSQALALTKQPFQAYSTLILMGMVFSQDTWAIYEEGSRRCPKSPVLRRAQLARLRTEWGGSIEAMYAFLERPEHVSLDQDALLWLRATVLHSEGHYLEHFGDDVVGARQKYLAAIDLRAFASPLIALIRRADSLEEAEALAARALKLEPESDDVRLALVHGYWFKFHKMKTAWAYVQEARAWGDPLAHDLWGGIPWWLKLFFRVGAWTSRT